MTLKISERREDLEAISRIMNAGEANIWRGSVRRVLSAYDAINQLALMLVFSVARENETNFAFAGMIVFKEKSKNSLSELSERFARLGIRLVSFVNIKTQYDFSPVYVSRDGASRADAADFVRLGVPVTYRFEEFDEYSGFDIKQICELALYAKKQGKKVAAVGYYEEFADIYGVCDTVISFSSANYRLRGGFERELVTFETANAPTGKTCPQTLRLESDSRRAPTGTGEGLPHYQTLSRRQMRLFQHKFAYQILCFFNGFKDCGNTAYAVRRSA